MSFEETQEYLSPQPYIISSEEETPEETLEGTEETLEIPDESDDISWCSGDN